MQAELFRDRTAIVTGGARGIGLACAAKITAGGGRVALWDRDIERARKSLGKELATTGVLVNCVAPAVVKTELFSQMTEQHIQYMLSKIPMNRFGEVDEVAEMVAWLASDLCTFATGATFDLSGGRATY